MAMSESMIDTVAAKRSDNNTALKFTNSFHLSLERALHEDRLEKV